MKKPTGCALCRWWKMDEHSDYIGDNRYKHGSCTRIHVGNAAAEQARLYPVGNSAWLYTAFNFFCSLYEVTKPKTAE